jgi:hypothetical protein
MRPRHPEGLFSCGAGLLAQLCFPLHRNVEDIIVTYAIGRCYLRTDR